MSVRVTSQATETPIVTDAAVTPATRDRCSRDQLQRVRAHEHPRAGLGHRPARAGGHRCRDRNRCSARLAGDTPDLPGRRVLGVAAALPLVIPSYVAALALLGAFGPRACSQKGRSGLNDYPRSTAPGRVPGLTLSTYPYVYLLVAAALRSLDPSLEEAARSLGQSRLATFRRVTSRRFVRRSGPAPCSSLSTLSPTSAPSRSCSTTRSPGDLPPVPRALRSRPRRDAVARAGALTALILVLEARSRRGVVPGAGVARPPPTASPSGVGVSPHSPSPAAWSHSSWLFRWRCSSTGRRAPRPAPISPGSAAVNSMSASAPPPPLPWLRCFLSRFCPRYPAPWTRALEHLSYSANALPGIVIALALVSSSDYAGPLYQTLALLVFAYVVRFFPQALAGVGRRSRRESPPRGGGSRARARPVATALTSRCRSSAPGLCAGAALVFLTAMKELPATLLLRPIGSRRSRPRSGSSRRSAPTRAPRPPRCC